MHECQGKIIMEKSKRRQQQKNGKLKQGREIKKEEIGRNKSFKIRMEEIEKKREKKRVNRYKGEGILSKG